MTQLFCPPSSTNRLHPTLHWGAAVSPYFPPYISIPRQRNISSDSFLHCAVYRYPTSLHTSHLTYLSKAQEKCLWLWRLSTFSLSANRQPQSTVSQKGTTTSTAKVNTRTTLYSDHTAKYIVHRRSPRSSPQTRILPHLVALSRATTRQASRSFIYIRLVLDSPLV